MNVKGRITSILPHTDQDVIIHPNARRPATVMYVALERAINPTEGAIVHLMRLAVLRDASERAGKGVYKAFYIEVFSEWGLGVAEGRIEKRTKGGG
jgi:hypothetical protein